MRKKTTDQIAADCEEHPDCVVITGPGGPSHADAELHVECRIAPGTTATHNGGDVLGREGLCDACTLLVGA